MAENSLPTCFVVCPSYGDAAFILHDKKCPVHFFYMIHVYNVTLMTPQKAVFQEKLFQFRRPGLEYSARHSCLAAPAPVPCQSFRLFLYPGSADGSAFPRPYPDVFKDQFYYIGRSGSLQGFIIEIKKFRYPAKVTHARYGIRR